MEYLVLHSAVLALDQELCSRIAAVRHTESDSQLVVDCVAQLNAMLGNIGLEWTCAPFGSCVNGFGMTNSDLDITCFQTDTSEVVVAGTYRSWLNLILRPRIERHPAFKVSKFICASIPILKLIYSPSPGLQLDVDLSCHNKAPLANTHLLRAYSQLHPAVRDLGIAVKLWARSSGVCGASLGNLSSYTFNLLTIYYLQVDPDVRLPCLPADAFAAHAYHGEGLRTDCSPDPRIQEVSWTTALPVAELLVRFFRFYAEDFRWGTEVASIRLGRRLEHDDANFQLLRERWSCRMHVEDPYQWERNLNCVLGEPEEAKLHASFVASSLHMQAGAEALLLCLHKAAPAYVPTALPSPVASDAESPEPEVVELAEPAPWPERGAGAWRSWWTEARHGRDFERSRGQGERSPRGSQWARRRGEWLEGHWGDASRSEEDGTWVSAWNDCGWHTRPPAKGSGGRDASRCNDRAGRRIRARARLSE